MPDGPSYRADTLTKAMLPKEAHLGASALFFWYSYGHLLVLIGYFKAIKHSINWVISLLKTGKRAITAQGYTSSMEC